MPLKVLESILYATDLESMLTFYCELLGLELVSMEPDRHVFFKCESSMLLVFHPEATTHQQVTVNGAVIPQHGAIGPGHLAFGVSHEELQAYRERLVRGGVGIESEVLWPNGAMSIYVRDPAGNSVEFATRDLWFAEE